MPARLLGFTLATFLLAGCASNQLVVTYVSDPPGATLYRDGQPVGYTPFTFRYSNADLDAGRCMRSAAMSVTWASGAQAGGQGITFCPYQGTNLVYGFRRPDGPGREVDAQIGMQMYQAAASREAAAQQARSAAAINLGAQMMNPQRPAPMLLPEPIRCTSHQMGSYTNTTCQ